VSRKPKSKVVKGGGRRSGAGRPGGARSAVIRIRATTDDLTGARALALLEQRSISDVGLAALRMAIARGSTR
jgi:hypothetical protein